jgi:hypothetical protein
MLHSLDMPNPFVAPREPTPDVRKLLARIRELHLRNEAMRRRAEIAVETLFNRREP